MKSLVQRRGVWQIDDVITITLGAEVRGFNTVVWTHETDPDFLEFVSGQDCVLTGRVLTCTAQVGALGDDGLARPSRTVQYRALAATAPGQTTRELGAVGSADGADPLGPIFIKTELLQIVGDGDSCDMTCQVIIFLIVGLVVGFMGRHRLSTFPPCFPSDDSGGASHPFEKNPTIRCCWS